MDQYGERIAYRIGLRSYCKQIMMVCELKIDPELVCGQGNRTWLEVRDSVICMGSIFGYFQILVGGGRMRDTIFSTKVKLDSFIYPNLTKPSLT